MNIANRRSACQLRSKDGYERRPSNVLDFIVTLVHRKFAPEFVKGGFLGAVLADSAVPVRDLSFELGTRRCFDDLEKGLSLLPAVGGLKYGMCLGN